MPLIVLRRLMKGSSVPGSAQTVFVVDSLAFGEMCCLQCISRFRTMNPSFAVIGLVCFLKFLHDSNWL